ncbi:MAG: hypothetical protein HY608_06740, partial [Planctomycetes bacterium]|nr:hypothetical protein [Planctomycetota bacterium]
MPEEPRPPEEEFSLSDLVRRKREIESAGGALPPVPPGAVPAPGGRSDPSGPRRAPGGAPFERAGTVERFDIRHQWGVVRRRWGVVTLSTLVVTATSVVATYRQPDVYEAVATLGPRRVGAAILREGPAPIPELLDMETVANRMRLPSLAADAARLVREAASRTREHPAYGAVTPEEAQEAYRVLVEGRPSLGGALPEEALDRLRSLFLDEALRVREPGLELPVSELLRLPAPEFEQAMRMDPGAIGSVEPVVTTDGEMLQLVSRGQGAYLCAVRCNALAIAFLLRDLRGQQEGTRRMEETLSLLTAEREEELTAKRREIQAYKEAWALEHRDEGGHLSADEERLLDRLKEAEASLREDRDNLRIREVRSAQVETALEEMRSSAIDTVRGNRAREALAEREVSLRLLLDRYGDRHPQVVQVRQEIESLRTELAATPVTAGGNALRDALEREWATLQADLAALGERVPSLSARVADLEGQLSNFRTGYELGLIRLTNEEEILASSLQDLRAGQQEARVARDAVIGSLQLEERAAMPGAGVGPDRSRSLMFSALAGLGLGVLAAFFLEHLDDTVKTSADVTRQLGVVPLGVIPAWAEGEPLAISNAEPQSMIADVYAVLRNNIRYASAERPERLLFVTSALKDEGKTQVCFNLALSYALEGNRVLLIDADLRRRKGGLTHVVEGMGKLRGTLGLGDFLEGRSALEEVFHEMEPPNLFFLPRGQDVKNPARLLRSTRLAQLLQSLEQKFEVVIVDSAAVVPVVDATLISPLVRGAVLVIAAD